MTKHATKTKNSILKSIVGIMHSILRQAASNSSNVSSVLKRLTAKLLGKYIIGKLKIYHLILYLSIVSYSYMLIKLHLENDINQLVLEDIVIEEG